MTTTPVEKAYYRVTISWIRCHCSKGADFDLEARLPSEPVAIRMDEEAYRYCDQILRLAGWMRCSKHESRAAEFIGKAERVTAGPFQPRIAKLYMARALREIARDQLQRINAKHHVENLDLLAKLHKTQLLATDGPDIVDQADAAFWAQVERLEIAKAIVAATQAVSHAVESGGLQTRIPKGDES